MRRYRVQIGEKSFDIAVRRDGEEYAVDVGGLTRSVSLKAVDPRNSHALIDGQSHEIDISKDNGTWDVTIGGWRREVEVVDFHLAELKRAAGVSHAAPISRELRAPMPGMTLKLAVCEGQEVKKGDTLIILEAMKMENLIKAAGAGTVAKIHVSEGTSVEKGQTLIEFS